MQPNPPSPGRPAPWGTVAALLTASVVTLVGVLRNLDPDVILRRVIAAALVVGIVVSLASGMIQRITRLP